MSEMTTEDMVGEGLANGGCTDDDDVCITNVDAMEGSGECIAEAELEELNSVVEVLTGRGAMRGTEVAITCEEGKN